MLNMLLWQSRKVQATRGITAGSGFATSELRVLLLPMMRHLHTAWATAAEAVTTEATTTKATTSRRSSRRSRDADGNEAREASEAREVRDARAEGAARGVRAPSCPPRHAWAAVAAEFADHGAPTTVPADGDREMCPGDEEEDDEDHEENVDGPFSGDGFGNLVRLPERLTIIVLIGSIRTRLTIDLVQDTSMNCHYSVIVTI